jgi:hypothetical protein
MVEHQFYLAVLEGLAQLLQCLWRPLVVRPCIDLDQLQVEAANQVGEMIGQADHAEVVRLAQACLAVCAELEQALFETCQVGLDAGLGLGGQAYQVGGDHIRHAPHVVARQPRLAVEAVGDFAGLYGDTRQATVYRACRIDFNDAYITAPGHGVERVIAPDGAQTDHRVGVDRQLLQGLGSASAEVGALAAAGQVGCGRPLELHVAALEQHVTQAIGDWQAGQHANLRVRVGCRQRGTE